MWSGRTGGERGRKRELERVILIGADGAGFRATR